MSSQEPTNNRLFSNGDSSNENPYPGSNNNSNQFNPQMNQGQISQSGMNNSPPNNTPYVKGQNVQMQNHELDSFFPEDITIQIMLLI